VLQLIVGVLLAAAAVVFVLKPLFRPELEGHTKGAAGALDEGEAPDDDLSPRAVALRALKEIEFDRATGKLSDTDYEALKRQYTEEALAALRADPGAREGPAAAAQRAPASGAVCPTHGLRPESDAQFCSECGRRLVAA
jgi:hypothetical protein